MAVDFSNYLSVPVDSIEAPKAAPTGHYFATFVSSKGTERFYDGKGGKATPVCELTLKLTGADTDAQEEDPIAAEKCVGKLVTKDYTLSEESGMYNLRRFVSETCGVDTKGLDLGDALDACKGSAVKVFNQPRAGKEEGQFYNNITKILPL